MSGSTSTALPGTSAAAATLPASTTRPVPSTLPLPANPVVTLAVAAPTDTLAPPADPARPLVTAPAGLPADGAPVGNRTVPIAFEQLPLAGLDEATREEVAQAVHLYLVAATVDPLRTGRPAELVAVLTDDAFARLQPATRQVLADEGLPVLTRLSVTRADTSIDGVVGPDGDGVAVAGVTFLVEGVTAGEAMVTVQRTGTLTLVTTPAGWRIDAFDLAVERSLP